MRKMKRFVKVIATLCVLLGMMIPTYANGFNLENAQKNSDNNASVPTVPVGFVVAVDSSGEVFNASSAVAVKLESGNAYVFSADKVYSDDTATYYWMDREDNKDYMVEPIEHIKACGILMWNAEAAGNGNGSLYTASTYEGESATLYYYNDNGEICNTKVTSDSLSINGDYPIVGLSGVPSSDIVFPAVVIGNYGCTGIVYDSTGMLAPVTTEENFHGNNNNTFIIIGVIVVLVIVIAVVSKKKKAAAQPTPQPMPQPVPQPMSQPMPQAIPQPMPQQMPQAEPVIRPQAQMSHLYAVGGVMNGRLYPLADEILIGRDVSCAVRFPADAKGVSRIHCKLFWQNGTLMLMDMNSSYGTFTVSGKLSPMKPVPVKAGDIFYIAEKNNQFKIQ